MDWKTLLQSVLPSLLEFLDTVLSGQAGTPQRSEAEKLTAAISLAQHALAIAGFRLPTNEQVGSVIQEIVNQMVAKGKLPGFKDGKTPSALRPHVGEIIRPSGKLR